jgi:hypothetical protein
VDRQLSPPLSPRHSGAMFTTDIEMVCACGHVEATTIKFTAPKGEFLYERPIVPRSCFECNELQILMTSLGPGVTDPPNQELLNRLAQRVDPVPMPLTGSPPTFVSGAQLQTVSESDESSPNSPQTSSRSEESTLFSRSPSSQSSNDTVYFPALLEQEQEEVHLAEVDDWSRRCGLWHHEYEERPMTWPQRQFVESPQEEDPRSPREGRDPVIQTQRFFGNGIADESLGSGNEAIPGLIQDNIMFLAPREYVEDVNEALANVSLDSSNVKFRSENELFMMPSQALSFQIALPPQDSQLHPVLNYSAAVFPTNEVSLGPQASLSPSPSSEGVVDPESTEGRGIIERIEGYQRKIDTLKKMLIKPVNRPNSQASEEDRESSEEPAYDSENSEEADWALESESDEDNNAGQDLSIDRFCRPETPVPGQRAQTAGKDDVYLYPLEAESGIWSDDEAAEEEFGFELELVETKEGETRLGFELERAVTNENRLGEPQLVEEYTYLTAGELELRKHGNPLNKWTVKHPSPLRGELLVVIPDQQMLTERRRIILTTWSDTSLAKLMMRSRRMQTLREGIWC